MALLGAFTFHFRKLIQVLATVLPIGLPAEAHPGRQLVMEFRSLLPTGDLGGGLAPAVVAIWEVNTSLSLSDIK